MFNKNKYDSFVDIRIGEFEITREEIEYTDKVLKYLLDIMGFKQTLNDFIDDQGNIPKEVSEEALREVITKKFEIRENLPDKMYKMRRLLSKIHFKQKLKTKFAKKAIKNPEIKQLIGRGSHLIDELDKVYA